METHLSIIPNQLISKSMSMLLKKFLLPGICVCIVLSGCLQEPMDIATPDEQAYDRILNIEDTQGCEAALTKWKQFLDKYPGSLKFDNAAYHLGGCYQALNMGSKSTSAYLQIESESTLYKTAQLKIVQTILQDFQEYSPEEAAPFLAPLLKDPDYLIQAEALWEQSQMYYQMATAQTTLQDQYYDSSLVALEQIINNKQWSPRLEASYYRIGWIQYQINRNQESIASFKNYIQSYPTGVYAESATYWQAKSYDQIGKPCESLTLYQLYINTYPNSDRTLNVYQEIQTNVCL